MEKTIKYLLQEAYVDGYNNANNAVIEKIISIVDTLYWETPHPAASKPRMIDVDAVIKVIRELK